MWLYFGFLENDMLILYVMLDSVARMAYTNLLFKEMIKTWQMSVGEMFCVLEEIINVSTCFLLFFSNNAARSRQSTFVLCEAYGRSIHVWLVFWHNHLFPMLDNKWAACFWFISTRQNWGNNLSSHILWVQNRTSKLTWGEFNNWTMYSIFS